MFFLLQWKICAQLATRIGVPAFCSWDRCKGTALRIIPGYPKPLQILPHLTRSILDSTAKSVLLPSLCKLKILFKLIGIPGLIKDNKAVVVQLVQARALRNRAAESEFCLSYLLYACSSIHQVIQNGLSGGFPHSICREAISFCAVVNHLCTQCIEITQNKGEFQCIVSKHCAVFLGPQCIIFPESCVSDKRQKCSIFVSPPQAWLSMHGAMQNSLSYRYSSYCCIMKKKEVSAKTICHRVPNKLCFLVDGTWLIIYLLETQRMSNAFPQFLATRYHLHSSKKLHSTYSTKKQL